MPPQGNGLERVAPPLSLHAISALASPAFTESYNASAGIDVAAARGESSVPCQVLLPPEYWRLRQTLQRFSAL